MNLPSCDKYEPLVQPEGVFILNASLINREINRTDLDMVSIPANEIAEELGNKRLTNMVLLGALLARLPVLSVEAIQHALQEHLPERHQHLLPPPGPAGRRRPGAQGDPAANLTAGGRTN